MKFRVKVQGFTNGIIPAAEVAAKSSKDFISDGKIKIVVEPKEIAVYAFSGIIGIESKLSTTTIDKLDYRFDTPGEVTVSAKDLLAVLSSFAPTESVVIEAKKDGDTQKLFITLERDDEQFQTLPCLDDCVSLPKESAKFENTLTITRDVLMKGISRVSFATGFEKERPRYKYWALKMFKNGTIRFSAGDGGRWAVLDLEGKSIVSSGKGEHSFLIHRDHTPIVMKVLEHSVDANVVLKQSAKNDSYHIVIEAMPHKMILVGLDPTVTSVDEDIFINRAYKHKVVTVLADWKYAALGVSATFNDICRKTNQSHKARIDFDFVKKTMIVKTDYSMSSTRKIPIVDSSVSDGITDSWFICSSAILKEITDCSEYGKSVQMEMSDAKEPVIVRLYAADKVTDGLTLKNVDDGTGITEKFCIIFASYGS